MNADIHDHSVSLKKAGRALLAVTALLGALGWWGWHKVGAGLWLQYLSFC